MTDPPRWLIAGLRAGGCVDPVGEARLLIGLTHDPARLRALMERRLTGMPVEVLVGHVDFEGVRVRVAPGVFLPRPRTALLARAAVESARRWAGPIVVDLCCGTGVVAAVVADRVAGARVIAADLDDAAVECARGNARRHGFEVAAGDLFDALPSGLRGAVAVVVANTPHVPTDELRHLPRDTREHEPALALDGGADGLDVLRRIAGEAGAWLRPGGELLTEVASHQADATEALLRGDADEVTVRHETDVRTAVVTARVAGSPPGAA